MDGNDFGVPSTDAFAGSPQPINPLNEDVVGSFIAMSPRYVVGSPGNWRVTLQRPDMGYGEWDSVWGSKFTASQLNNPKGVFGYNEAYVSMSQDMIAQERGEKPDTSVASGLESLGHSLNPFTTNHDELQRTLESEDREFSAKASWEQWSESNPELTMFLKDRSFDFSKVQGTKNRDAFMFGINLELVKAQREQEIDDFTKSAGRFARWSNTGTNFVVADILFDPDTTNAAALAGMGKLVGVAGKAVGVATKAPRLVAAMEAATSLGGIHNAIAKANRLKHVGAIALEGGTYGIGLGLQHESHAMEMADILEGENARSFRMENVGYSGALGVGLGVSLYLGGMAVAQGLGKGMSSLTRKRIMDATDIADEPIAQLGATMEGLALQHVDDEALSKINRLLAESSTDAKTNASVGWAMSRPIVEASGRTMDEVGALAERLLTVKNKLGSALPPRMIDDVLTEFLMTGKAVALNEAEEIAMKRALGAEHALRIKQANPSWRAKMESARDSWDSALARANLLVETEKLSPADINSILDGTPIKNVKGDYTLAELKTFVQQQRTAINHMLMAVPEPRAAAAATLNGDRSKLVAEGGQYEPKTSAGRILVDLEAMLAKKRPPKGKIEAMRKRIVTVFPTPAPTVMPVARDAFKMTGVEKQSIFDAKWTQLEETPNEVLQGTGMVAKIVRKTFGADYLRKIVMSRTGANVSVYSRFKPIRNLIALMGEPVATSAMGGKGVNFTASARRALREFSPVQEALATARQKMNHDEWVKFNREVKLALDMQQKLPETHPHYVEGNLIIKRWSQWMKSLHDRGVSNRSVRMFKEKSVFAPNRLNYGWVRGNAEEAQSRLASHWKRSAVASGRLNPAVLERMKWLTKNDKNKYVPVEGSFYDTFLKTQLSASPNKKPKRPVKANLSPEQLAEYAKAIDSVDDKGRSVWQLAARDYLLRIQGLDAFRGTAREWNEKVLGNRLSRSTRTVMKRRITQREIAANPELQDIFESDLMSLGMEYAQHAGANIHIQDAVNRFMGAKGFTSYDILNQLERKAKAEWADSPEAIAELTASFENAHEKLSELMGAIPNIESSYTGVANFGFDAVNKGAFMAYAGGLGLSMMPETMAMLMHKVTDLKHLGSNLAGVLRSFKSKDEMRGTIFALRAVASGQANRFHTGAIDGTFAMTSGERWLKPWQTMVRTASGTNKMPPGSNRGAAAILKGIDAVGDNLFRAGGGYAINNFSWSLAIQEAEQSAARYLPAAKKLRTLLAESPIPALTNDAEVRAFKGLARRAGFGDNFDTALAFVKHDLMDEGMIEAIEAGMKATGQKRAVSLDQLELWALDQDKVAKDAYHRIAEMTENLVRHRVPEMDPMLRRTDVNSRTGIGRLFNLFQSYGQAWYTSKILNAQGMPGGKIMGQVFALALSEFLIGKLREMVNGRSVDEIQAELENDPAGAMVPYIVRLPWLGTVTPWLELGTNLAVAPERAYTPNPLAGPASAAIRSVDRGRAIIQSMVYQDERKADIITERTLNGLAKMNWMTHALYNNLLADAMGYAEQQDGRLNRRFGAPAQRPNGPGLMFESDFDPRRELKLPRFEAPAEFNLNEALRAIEK